MAGEDLSALGLDDRKEKSMSRLSQRFVQMFMLSKNRSLGLDEAARALLGGCCPRCAGLVGWLADWLGGWVWASVAYWPALLGGLRMPPHCGAPGLQWRCSGCAHAAPGPAGH